MFKAYINPHNIISVLVSNAIDLFIIGGRTGTMYIGPTWGPNRQCLGAKREDRNVKFVVQRINNITVN